LLSSRFIHGKWSSDGQGGSCHGQFVRCDCDCDCDCDRLKLRLRLRLKWKLDVEVEDGRRWCIACRRVIFLTWEKHQRRRRRRRLSTSTSTSTPLKSTTHSLVVLSPGKSSIAPPRPLSAVTRCQWYRDDHGVLVYYYNRTSTAARSIQVRNQG
jgi:hypothetical protein